MTTPMAEIPESLRDHEYNLKLLGIFHYVLAGLTALIGCFPILHVVVGFIMIVIGAADGRAGPMPILGGLLFTLIGGLVFVVFQAMAVCLFLSGKFLQAHKHHTYCLVVAVMICFSFPVGTVLGIFTLLVLIRPEVRSLFGAK